MKFEIASLIFLVSILSVPFARAEDTSSKTEPPTANTKDDRKSFNLYIENDTKKLGGPGSDSNYTNGIRFSVLYATNLEPKWAKYIPWIDNLFKEKTFNFSLGLGQQIYTPEDLTRSDAQSNDRPYAGWLYLSPSLNVIGDKTVDTYGIDFGVIGPPSFGREVQREFHRAITVGLPQGWDHQLGAEIGFVLNFQRQYRFLEVIQKSGWKMFDTIPFFGGSLGNIYTGGGVGGLFRFGYNISSDFGPTRPSGQDNDPIVQPTIMNYSENIRSWEYYAFGGLKGSAVAHNIFLDGNSFQDSLRVTRVPFLLEYEGGVFIRFKSVGLTWSQISRTPEFYETYKPHTFASVSLSYGSRF